MNWTREFRLSSPLEITAAAQKPLPSYADEGSAVRNLAPWQWSGGVTYAEAVALAESGWMDAPRLDILAEQIAPTEARASFEMQHAVTGAFIDVARFVEGHPENMLEFCDEPAPRSIALAVNICKDHEQTARQLELAGAVALAVLDTLRAAKIATSLDAIAATGGVKGPSKKPEWSGNYYLFSFPLSRAEEQIDQNQLAFWLCHPAAFRRLIFGFWDICPRDFYTDTRQATIRGGTKSPTAKDVPGFDYILTCSPATEEAARAEYHRIISEITATL